MGVCGERGVPPSFAPRGPYGRETLRSRREQQTTQQYAKIAIPKLQLRLDCDSLQSVHGFHGSLWRSAAKSTAPLKELFSGADLRRLGQLFIVMTGAWLTLNATVGALPGVINAVLRVKSSGVNTGILIGAGISAVLYPLIGLLSQTFGRRPTIAVIGLLNLIPACTLYYVLVASGYRDPTTLIILVALIMVLSLPVWAVHTPYLAESFRTGIRSSGYGVSYSLATILPGLYALYMLGLGALMPYAYTPIVLLALGGLFLSIGALAGQETKDVDFHWQDVPRMA